MSHTMNMYVKNISGYSIKSVTATHTWWLIPLTQVALYIVFREIACLQSERSTAKSKSEDARSDTPSKLL